MEDEETAMMKGPGMSQVETRKITSSFAMNLQILHP